METKVIITSSTEDWEFGLWEEDFTPIDSDNLKEMSEKFCCTPELLDLIRDNFLCLQGDLIEDLKDIWKKAG